MASLRDTIRLALEGDATLTAILTGGVYDASELDREGLSLSDVSKQADGVRIKPTAVLRWRGSNPTDQSDFIPGVESRFMEVWVYADQGYATIDSAIRRIKTLLDLHYFTSDNEGLTYLRWAGDIGEIEAPELGNATADRSRYQIILVRK